MWPKDATMADISRGLSYLFDRGVMTTAEMDYLVSDPFYGDAIICYSLIVDNIFAAIKDGQLKRWDFDVFDQSHHEQDRSALYAKKPGSWGSEKEYDVVRAIIGTFRRRCVALTDALVKGLKEADDFQEMADLQSQAFELGFIHVVDGELRHDHSFLNSGKVFEALDIAIRRLHGAASRQDDCELEMEGVGKYG